MKELWNDATTPAPTFSIAFSYGPTGGSCVTAGECGGYLRKKAFKLSTSTPFYSIDRDRDGNTGVILATRDTAGVQTNYTYDALGRVVSITPSGEQTTNVDYVSLLQTTVTQGALGSYPVAGNYLYTSYIYDTIGRLVATEKRPADPVTRGYVCQRTQYDILNHVTFQSEPAYVTPYTCAALPEPALQQSTCAAGVCLASCWAAGLSTTPHPVVGQAPVIGTEFDFSNSASGKCEPFGRLRREIPDDANLGTKQNVVETAYFGNNSKVTVNGVAGPGATPASATIPFAAVTSFYKDGFDRLTVVDAPSNVGADAYYDYDTLGRLTKVRLSDNLNKTQVRRFGYDGLGRMLWAENPESGTTEYKAYDALGNLLKVQDAKGNVQLFTYDFAGRLSYRVVKGQGATDYHTIVTNAYDESGRGSSLGKLTTTTSFDDSGTSSLMESCTYSGVGGRLSQLKDNFSNWSLSDAVTTNYNYTSRGEILSIIYPQEATPNRSVFGAIYSNVNGAVIGVSESESDGTGSASSLGAVAYNAAGGVETVVMPGGNKTTITYDTRSRPRTVTGGILSGQTGKWSYESGTYAYDGAGNIYQIGSNKYGYDAANRLATAHTVYNSNTYDETFQYDVFGNMSVRSMTSTTPSSTTETDVYTLDAPSTPTTNRILSGQTTIDGTASNTLNFVYDPNGNLVQGGRRSSRQEDIKRFQYDSLNRMTAVQQISNVGTGSESTSEVDRFGYDGSGNRLWRVEKGFGVIVYSVRDASGRVLSEFRAPAVGSREWAADYIYLAGRLLGMKQNAKPRMPVNLRATQTSVTNGWKITLVWDDNPEPVSKKYIVYRLREGIDNSFIPFSTQPTTASFADATVYTLGQAVKYWVTCVDVTTTYESSPSAALRLVAGDNASPSQPVLTATAGDSRVLLSWSASGDNASVRGYEVRRRLTTAADPLLNSMVLTPLVTGASYVDLNLTNGTTYYYIVRAIDTSGNFSIPSQGPLPGVYDTPATPVDFTPPSPPKNVAAATTCGSTDTIETIRISWTPSDCSSCTYDVYRNTEPDFTGLSPFKAGLPTVPASYLDDTFTPTLGVTYYYAMRANDGLGGPASLSELSNVTSMAVVRDMSLGVPPHPWAKNFDGKVQLRWSTETGVQASGYRVYRKLNSSPVVGCGDYVYVGTASYNSTIMSSPGFGAWEFTDYTVENNQAYNYVVTRVVGTIESEFSQPTLGMPLGRPSNIYQCYLNRNPFGSDAPFGAGFNLLQWAPPEADFLNPGTLGNPTARGPLGYLNGYHLYHHMRCNVTDFSGTILWDNSPTREFLFTPANSFPQDDPYAISDQRDPYLIRRRTGFEYQDPRYPVNNSPDGVVSLSPAFHGDTSTTNMFWPDSSYCNNVNHDVNCVMPKAAYKVLAEGVWLPAESDWPDYFDAYGPVPGLRCQDRLVDAWTLPDCSDGRANDFLPPPSKVSVSGGYPAILSWLPPRITPGRPRVAGYYLYDLQTDVGGIRTSNFHPPLPFAKVPADQTSYALYEGQSSANTLRVVAEDEAGHLSGEAPGRCAISGAYCLTSSWYSLSCPRVCSLTLNTCVDSTSCPSAGSCSVSGAGCSNSCPMVCDNNRTQACTPPPPPQSPPPIVRKQVAKGGTASATSFTMSLTNKPGSGNALIAVIGTRGVAARQVASISSPGVTWYYAKDAYYVGTGVNATLGGVTSEVWYAPNVNATSQVTNSNVVTVTLVSTLKIASGIVVEYSGIDKTVTALDQTLGSGGTGSDITVRYTPTTTKPNEVWVAGLASSYYITTFDPAASSYGFTEVTESPSPKPGGTAIHPGESSVFEERIINQESAAGIRLYSSGSFDVWSGVVATFKGMDPPPPPPDQCPGGTCVSQTCNPGAGNQCLATDVCQQTIGRFCQSNGSVQCDTVADCPQYHSGHCSSTTATACDPTGPTIPCPGEVCVPGDLCNNSSQTTPTATLNAGSSFTPPRVNNNLPYDKTVLPPPQGLNAWAPTGGTSDDHDIYLKWCPEPTTTTARIMPDVQEYVVYRGQTGGGPYRQLARIDPACVETVNQCNKSGAACSTPNTRSSCTLSGEMCAVQLKNRCEIMDHADPRVPAGSTAVACVGAESNAPAVNCAVIHPTEAACSNAAGSTAKPCAIVDLTFDQIGCWPRGSYMADLSLYRYLNNYYVVTAKAQYSPTVMTESMPSFENAGWLNYCAPEPTNTTNWGYCCSINATPTPACAPYFQTCHERRDPDGHGAAPACSDGNVELKLDGVIVDPSNLIRLVDGPNKIASYETDGMQAPYRIIGAGGKVPPPPLTYNPPSRFVFYHLDHLGSPRVEMSDTGVLLAKHDYLPFGQETSNTADPTLNTRAYTGHERDAESGLDYMLARYYSSSLARFMTPDPGDDADFENPQSWNKYAYVQNNPINNTDPTGLFTTELHASITENVLGNLKFGGPDIALVVAANIRQDSVGGGRLHWTHHGTGFGSTASIRGASAKYAEKQLHKAVRAAGKGNMQSALRHLGKGLHTVQDLVAHREFPNLPDNTGRLDAHADNDENPSGDDLIQAIQDSREYVQKFQDAIGGTPQATGESSQSAVQSNTTAEPSGEWYRQRALVPCGLCGRL